MSVKLKRIYENVSEEDGFRVLVDRIWPRGVSKKEASIDKWLKEVAPSNDLRKWFQHDPDKFKEFEEKYKQELNENSTKKEQLEELKNIVEEHSTVTLLYSAKDEEHNQAVVLTKLIENSPSII